MQTDPATIAELKVTGLACVRGERRLFDSLSFSLNPGEGLWLRGANGSGKSTLLRLLAGLLTPSAGQIVYDGANIADDLQAWRRHIAYLGHLDGLKPTETPREALGFLAKLRSQLQQTSDILNIKSYADTPMRYLSAGQRRRVALAGVLASGAELWLLDEPTTALDADTTALVYDALRHHIASGGIVIAATHDEPPAMEGVNIISLSPS